MKTALLLAALASPTPIPEPHPCDELRADVEARTLALEIAQELLDRCVEEYPLRRSPETK
jgi:hypothetical protein